MENDPRYPQCSSERRDGRDVVSAVETPHHVFVYPPSSFTFTIAYNLCTARIRHPASNAYEVTYVVCTPSIRVATLHLDRLWTHASSALIFLQSVQYYSIPSLNNYSKYTVFQQIHLSTQCSSTNSAHITPSLTSVSRNCLRLLALGEPLQPNEKVVLAKAPGWSRALALALVEKPRQRRCGCGLRASRA